MDDIYHNLPETNKAIDMTLELAKRIAAEQTELNPNIVDLATVNVTSVIQWLENNRPNDLWIALAPFR